MRHLGDITKIDGYAVPITDCVVGGSPCQDLSVAGLRKGMRHSALGDEETTRSGLFMEQVRITKEMREHDRHEKLRSGRTDEPIRPRYMLYENVPGAFSSNNGEDFRCVLEEVARIAEEGVIIPRPTKGKWTTSGCIAGDGWSIAWRVFDAQFWGVPQRRRRICLVADFNGYSAAEIVFNEDKQHGSSNRNDSDSSVGHLGAESGREVQPVSEGLSGNLNESESQGEASSADVRGCSESSHPAFTYQDREGCPGGGKGGLIQEDRATSLRTNNYMTLFQPFPINEPNGEPAVVYDARGNGDGNIVPTMTGDHQNRITDYTGVIVQPYRKTSHPRTEDEPQGWEEADKNDTLNIFDNSEMRTPTVIVSMDRETFNVGQNFAQNLGIREDGIQPTLVARGPGGVCYTIQSTPSDMTLDQQDYPKTE